MSDLEKFPEELAPAQHAALVALLAVPNLTLAAQKAGVDVSTLRRWMQEERFRSELRAARREAIEEAANWLQSSCSGAVGVLLEVAKNKKQSGSARVAAASRILDFALRAQEATEFAARLDALESRNPK